MCLFASDAIFLCSSTVPGTSALYEWFSNSLYEELKVDKNTKLENYCINHNRRYNKLFGAKTKIINASNWLENISILDFLLPKMLIFAKKIARNISLF